MTQVSTTLLLASCPPLHSATAESGSDACEEPDSPGPNPPHPEAPPTARPEPAPVGSRAAPDDVALGNPLAEPVAALLGAGLAVLTLLVPLFTVLSDRREPQTGQREAAPAVLVLRSEGIDSRADGGGSRLR
jgi:hypothetical protein